LKNTKKVPLWKHYAIWRMRWMPI